jgi:hypothetical protein
VKEILPKPKITSISLEYIDDVDLIIKMEFDQKIEMFDQDLN